jgi:rhodanese-related sulfurtransferase
MGPLVPVLISNEFDLIIALFLGFGFGFVLEQAGFSKSTKLVGLFYGYDFVVLKVFFTAGITAMIGVLALGHFGLLDLSLLYINPTFLTSAIVGGIIMGLGFIVGGFCPGTSICAAAIGKIDAFIFILGSMIGIYLFLEIYPLVKDLYMDRPLGALKMYEILGMSSTGFAFLLTSLAISAFVVATYVENKVNKISPVYPKLKIFRWSMLAIIPFIFIIIVGFTPDKKEKINRFINDPENLKECNVRRIDADKFVYDLIHDHYNINVIDVRGPDEYKKFHLPLAINIPIDSMANTEWIQFLHTTYKTNIYYSNDSLTSKKACRYAKLLGNENGFVLCSTPDRFKAQFYSPEQPAEGSSKEAVDLYHFRVRSGKRLQELIKKLDRFNQIPVVKKPRRVQGGCT